MSRTAHSPFIALISRSHARSPSRVRDARQQGFQHLCQIADEGYVDLDVLVDLRRIDLDMNLLCVGRIGRERAGDAVVEAHAAGDEQIGFLDRLG